MNLAAAEKLQIWMIDSLLYTASKYDLIIHRFFIAIDSLQLCVYNNGQLSSCGKVGLLQDTNLGYIITSFFLLLLKLQILPNVTI